MNELKALTWLDWRMVRRDVLLLAAIAIATPSLVALNETPGAVLATLAWALLPLICTLLGATLVANPQGLPFLRARPLDWNLATAWRLALRCALAWLVTLLSLVVVLLTTPDGADLANWLAEGPSGWLGATFAVIGFTCAGAACAALLRQPAGAALIAWLLYSLGSLQASEFASGLLAGWLDVSLRKSDMWVLLAPLAVGPAALSALAAYLLLREREVAEPRVPWRALATLSLVTAGVLAILVLPLSARAAWELHRLHRAAESSPLAVGLTPPLESARLEEMDEWIRERELWHRAARRQRLDEIGWPLTQLRLSVGEDRIAKLPLADLRPLLEPVDEDLDLLAESILDPSLSDEQLLAVSRHLEHHDAAGSRLNAALLSRARVLQADGRTEDARRAFAATWRLHDVLRRSGLNAYFLAIERAALELQLRAALDASPTPSELPSALRDLDLRQGIVLDVLSRSQVPRGRSWWWPLLEQQRRVWERARVELSRLRISEEALALNPCVFTEQDLAQFPGRLRSDLGHGLQESRRLELLAELTARVLESRQGKPLDSSSRCPDATWVETRHGDGSWSLHLENGPIELRHDEPAPSDTHRE